jgi:hypothetical protein
MNVFVQLARDWEEVRCFKAATFDWSDGFVEVSVDKKIRAVFPWREVRGVWTEEN